jgi:hypothetical protein
MKPTVEEDLKVEKFVGVPVPRVQTRDGRVRSQAY